MTASDVIGDAINRLRAADGTLHVVAHAMFETALEQARSADDAVARGDSLGPLHGVPIGLKDLYDVAGVPTAAGSMILGDTVVDPVRNLEAAGAIVVAKTTMTEFAGATHNDALPMPVNPYDPTRSPAGSSSGSAVAVAAGLLPAALGSDTVTSIRMPAAWNGCVGFKPSYGRVSRHGVFPLAVPRPHVDGVDVAEVHVREHGNDVAQLTLVDLTRPRTHWPLRNPPRRVLAERDLAGVGIDPDAAEHVGLDRGEPTTSIGLAGERRVSGDLLAEVPIARLVAATGQLADVAEGTGSGHDRLLVLGANL